MTGLLILDDGGVKAQIFLTVSAELGRKVNFGADREVALIELEQLPDPTFGIGIRMLNLEPQACRLIASDQVVMGVELLRQGFDE